MKYPTIRVVFDRKHQATKQKTALVQLEILHERKRKYISTGVKVYAGQWKEKTMVTGRFDAIELNDRICAIEVNVKEFINGLIKKKEPFTFDALDGFMTFKKVDDSFIEFVRGRIEERKMEGSTRKQHLVMLHKLMAFGKIQSFSDLTTANIKLIDDFVKKNVCAQTTVYSFHKKFKVYVKEAFLFGFIEKNPYDLISIDRGAFKTRKYLTNDELKSIEKAVIPDESIARVRDCFVFCCYTGLAYADLRSFNWEKDVEFDNEKCIIRDTRCKTDVQYNVTILPPAMRILERYDYKLPVITNQQYNLRLKVLASYAKIKKNLTSHVARHTFATWALSNGISIEIVSKMLAHTDIKTTQIYAKVLQEDVSKGFDLLSKIV